ncbi:MAG TPA: sodium:solute symporter, partial [Leptospiraceae bacterium]|nr:sodium:solute symporter [Leptospiraceae bacterium]
MNILDLSALIGYFIIIFAAGLYFGKKGGKDDYYLGGKNLHWNFLMLSIIATETSSLTFLGVPGMSYKGGIQFLQTALGFLFGRIIVAYVFLPLYLKSDISSVYEWIGVMFGKHVQRFSSTLFLFTRLLGDGIRLYATSIPCALLLGNWVQGYSETEVFTMSLAAITAGTMIYTVYGGFKSVVATDSIQFLVYIAGGLFAAGFLLHSLDMPFNEIISKTYSLGKLKLYNGFEGNFLTSPYFFLNGFAGGLILTICSHGIDQMFAQRLLACGSLREAKLALIGSGIFVFFQFMLFLFIGILLFLYYGETGIAQDKIFSKFILEQIPSPIKGLILAGILASAMSTLSSSINSMSLSIQVDLFKTSHSSLR